MIEDIRTRAAVELKRRGDRHTVTQHEVKRLEREHAGLIQAQDVDRQEAEEFEEAIRVWNVIMEKTALHNLQTVVEMTNGALAAILPDRDLKIEIRTRVKHDKQVYSFVVMDAGRARTGTSGTGGSVLTVVSLILRVMFIRQTRRARFLLLDESLKAISEDYKPYTSSFLHNLAHVYGMHLVLVTHDPALTLEADRHYHATAPEKGKEAEGNEMRAVSHEEVQSYFRSLHH